MSVCKTCGAPIVQPPRGRRVYCSERCRKRQYQVPCERCGQPAGGIGTQRGKHGPTRFCVPCGKAVAAEIKREATRPQRELVERMWAEGRSPREICEAIGYGGRAYGAKICNMRQRGYDPPPRRPAFSAALRRQWAAGARTPRAFPTGADR